MRAVTELLQIFRHQGEIGKQSFRFLGPNHAVLSRKISEIPEVKQLTDTYLSSGVNWVVSGHEG